MTEYKNRVFAVLANITQGLADLGKLIAEEGVATRKAVADSSKAANAPRTKKGRKS